MFKSFNWGFQFHFEVHCLTTHPIGPSDENLKAICDLNFVF